MEQTILLRAEEAARMLQISRSGMFRLMAEGRVPGVVRIGRSVRLSREALENWVQQQVDEQDQRQDTSRAA